MFPITSFSHAIFQYFINSEIIFIILILPFNAYIYCYLIFIKVPIVSFADIPSLINVSFLQICLMLIAAAFAVEEKTVQKRGLYLGDYGLSDLGGLSGYGGLDGGLDDHKQIAIAIKEKTVAVPVLVPHPVPVTVDRPVPVKVMN